MSPAAAAASRVLVLGATSDIAGALTSALSERGATDFVLAARNGRRLAAAAEALRASPGTRVHTLPLEAGETTRHEQLVGRAFELLGGIDLVILAIGVLGERGGVPEDLEGAVEVLRVNALGSGSLLLGCVRALRAQGSGTVVVLSSVAAERPRRTNVVYGASKAALDALAQGLSDALRGSGVRVMVVRPGFVRTRMTDGLPPAPLSTTPAAVAQAALDGLDRGAITVWAPPALRVAMGVLRLLPRAIFRRLPV